MTKIILAATVAVIATMSFGTQSQAGMRIKTENFDISIGFDSDKAPRHVEKRFVEQRYVQNGIGYESDEDECFFKKIQKINRYGELVIKKVQVCN